MMKQSLQTLALIPFILCLSACNLSQLLPEPTTPQVTTIANKTIKITVISCEAIPLEASNLECRFDATNLTNNAVNWETVTDSWKLTLVSGTPLKPNNISIGSAGFSIRRTTTLAPSGTVRVNVRWLVPVSTTSIKLLDIDLDNYQGSDGTLTALQVIGSTTESKPSGSTAAGNYEFRSLNYWWRLLECRSISRKASNVACQFKIYNLEDSARSYRLDSPSVLASFNGRTMRAENLFFTSQLPSTSRTINFSPNGSQDLTIYLTASVGTTLIPQLDIDVDNYQGSDATLKLLAIQGVVLDPNPVGASASGIYEYVWQGFKIKFLGCATITGSPNLECRLQYVNLLDELRLPYNIQASSFRLTLINGQQVQATSVRWNTGTAGTGAVVNITGNESADLITTYVVPTGNTRIPQMDVDPDNYQGFDFALKDLLIQ